MNLNVFIPIDLEKISKLKFLQSTVPYIYSELKNSDDSVHYGVIHLLSEENYDKITSKFSGTDYKIKEKDKVYVLPNCSIPQFKIKEFLKEKNASFTNDYTKATAYLGSANCLKTHISEGNDTISILGGMSYYNMYVIDNNFISAQKYTSPNYKMIYDNASSVFMNRKTLGKYPHAMQEDHHYLLPLGAAIIYNILANKIPVISEESFINQGTEACIINDELYDSLKDMLSSEDESNQLLALQTAANCNIQKSKVYIYFLAKNFARLFRNSRFKNIKLFYNASQMSDLEYMSGGEFISKLMEENPDQMTSEAFKKIISTEIEEFTQNLTSDLFDIVVMPKRKFAKFHDNLTFTYELDEE